MDARRRELAGAGTLLGTEIVINFGSALAGLLIPVVGAVVVVAARQVVLAATLAPFYRPRRQDLAWRALWPGVVLGLALVVMNLSFYVAIARLGLGITAVIEYLGPFTLAIVGSRRVLDVFCALAALGGVLLLTEGDARVDAVGIGCALIAAASWAAYILFTRRAALRMRRFDGATVASIVSTAILLPIALVVADWTRVGGVWLLLLALGLLSSTIPYTLDTFVLRRITPRVYGILTAIGPAIAAVWGVIVLGEHLAAVQWCAIGVVVVASVVAVATQRRG